MIKMPKNVSRRSKRVGRGIGSGKGGHTVGRGVKGQKARGKVGILFAGVKVKKSLMKKLPLRRGKGRFGPKDKPIVVKSTYLNLLDTGSVVDVNLLVKKGIVDIDEAKSFGIKILGDGEITKKLTVCLPTSKSAAKMIEKAGGKIEPQVPTVNKQKVSLEKASK